MLQIGCHWVRPGNARAYWGRAGLFLSATGDDRLAHRVTHGSEDAAQLIEQFKREGRSCAFVDMRGGSPRFTLLGDTYASAWTPWGEHYVWRAPVWAWEAQVAQWQSIDLVCEEGNASGARRGGGGGLPGESTTRRGGESGASGETGTLGESGTRRSRERGESWEGGVRGENEESKELWPRENPWVAWDARQQGVKVCAVRVGFPAHIDGGEEVDEECLLEVSHATCGDRGMGSSWVGAYEGEQQDAGGVPMPSPAGTQKPSEGRGEGESHEWGFLPSQWPPEREVKS